jgi:hypothetical protein
VRTASFLFNKLLLPKKREKMPFFIIQFTILNEGLLKLSHLTLPKPSDFTRTWVNLQRLIADCTLTKHTTSRRPLTLKFTKFCNEMSFGRKGPWTKRPWDTKCEKMSQFLDQPRPSAHENICFVRKTSVCHNCTNFTYPIPDCLRWERRLFV